MAGETGQGDQRVDEAIVIAAGVVFFITVTLLFGLWQITSDRIGDQPMWSSGDPLPDKRAIRERAAENERPPLALPGVEDLR